TQSDSSYRDIYNKMVELGQWQEIEVVEVDGEEVPFDQVDVDEDTFKALVEQQAEIKKQTLTENKIDISGTSAFTQKLIEIEKKGGDVNEALRVWQAVEEPLSQLDTSTKEGQKQISEMYLKQKGLGAE